MGGLPKAVVSMASAQASAGAACAVLYYGDGDGETSMSGAYGQFPGFDRVSFLRVDPSRRELWTAARAMAELRDFRPDLVQTHGLWEPLLHRAQLYALENGLPFGLTPHSMLHPWQAGNKRVAKWLVTRVLGRRGAWRRASFVQALTESEAARLRKTGFGRIEVFPNGIFPEEDPGERHLELAGWNGEPFVLFLSRLHPQKAPDTLLEAFAGLVGSRPGLRLVMAGPDYGLEAPLRRAASELGLEKLVLFPGELTGERKWAVLRRAACFCLPSRAEGFSLALLEAALAGTPIVMSEACGFPELAEAGGAKMYGGDAASLARELDAVLEDPRAARDMGGRARRAVLDQYTWGKLAERQLALYRRVVGEGA